MSTGGKADLPAKPILNALAGKASRRPPVWLMRQAGRYLPEYRALRQRSKDFLEFCFTPERAAEATMQPIRRFGMDAAILFSDILVIPHALGQGVAFREGEGPVLERLRNRADIAALRVDGVEARLAPVYETVRQVKMALPPETTLIGFAGGPWTVATYMVEGGPTKDFRRVKLWAYSDPEGFTALIDLITEATVEYLMAQIAAGAEAVQLFDTWAGVLAEAEFERWVLAPTRKIVNRLKERYANFPVIGFPRGAGILYRRYLAETGIDAIGVDTACPAAFAREELQGRAAVQGNLDPVLLIAGGAPLRRAVQQLRSVLGAGPFIFNLGHGVLPQTPPENVAELARWLAEPIEPV